MAKTATAEPAGMRLDELKTHVHFARDTPVQIAFALGSDGKAVLLMDRRRPGITLGKELKEQDPKSSNHRWGTAMLDPHDPHVLRLSINKSVTGMAAKLALALKGTGCGKVRLHLGDGREFDDEAKEQPGTGGHGASHPAAPQIAKARQAWLAARELVEDETGKLIATFEDAVSDHHMADALGAKLRGRIATVLHHLDDLLAHKLAEVNAAKDAPARERAVAEAHQLIARYSKHIASDPTVRELDGNPFVKLTLGATLTKTLASLSKAIA